MEIIDWKIVLALGGWLLAFSQFFFTYRLSKKRDEDRLLEKTLGYFERGTQARSIAISLIDGIWIKDKQNIDIILPVLIGQAIFLLTEAEECRQEERNLMRLLSLIEKCLPYSGNRGYETAEISEALMAGARSKKRVGVVNPTLKIWYAKFNHGSKAMWEAEGL